MAVAHDAVAHPELLLSLKAEFDELVELDTDQAVVDAQATNARFLGEPDDDHVRQAATLNAAIDALWSRVVALLLTCWWAGGVQGHPEAGCLQACRWGVCTGEGNTVSVSWCPWPP